jgi:acetylornithine deacetylase/succinyl-diaminopimelate desuccinylase-like protein
VRRLLSRLEDERTGAIKLKALHVKIPKARLDQIAATARVLKHSFLEGYPWASGMQPVERNIAALLRNRTWFPSLAITGAAGLPDLNSAGNVLRPYTSLKLSIRVPPTCDAARATQDVKRVLEADPPYGARVEFEAEKASQGWNAPALAGWLEQSLDRASRATFGKAAAYLGEGGSIPFMAMLGERFPEAQFFITGVLGPASNAHGPNEFLHLPTAERVTQCVSHVLAAHAAPRAIARPARKRAAPVAKKKRGSSAARKRRA